VQQYVVSFSDADGIEHSVEVSASSLLEAAALALKAFKDGGCAPGPASRLMVKVTPPCLTHVVRVQRVLDWLSGGARSPREALLKRRLSGGNE
jgi:hypothetical protein